MDNINRYNTVTDSGLADFLEQSSSSFNQIEEAKFPIVETRHEEYPATMTTLVDLIDASGLTPECINALRNLEDMKGLVIQYEILYQNELRKDKMVLHSLCEEIFIHSSHLLPQIISLFAWCYVYEEGCLPRGQQDALLSFLGYSHPFALINTASGSSKLVEQSSGSYCNLEEFAQFQLNGIVKGYSEMPKELQVLIDEIIKIIQTSFKEDENWSCLKLVYGFFDEELSTEQCKSLTDYMNHDDGWLGNRSYYLVLYLRILEMQDQNGTLPPMPDLSSIKNESAKILIENIELQIRGKSLNLPLSIGNVNPKKRKEIEGGHAIQEISKKARAPYPADISTLVKWIVINGCVQECIKKMREIEEMVDFIEGVKISLEGDFDQEQKLLHSICQEVFENSTNKDLLAEIISYFAWNFLYEEGHLPMKDGDPLLDFLGYSYPFELITTNPENSKSVYCNLDQFSNFVICEGDTIKPINVNSEKIFFELALSQTDDEYLSRDMGTPLEEMLYSFFNGEVDMQKCKALLRYVILDESWLLERSHYFAQYLKILAYQKKNNLLPKMPDLKSIENEHANILVKNIELSARGKDLELPKFSDQIEIALDEVKNKKKKLWKILKEDSDSDSEEDDFNFGISTDAINFGTSQPTHTSRSMFYNLKIMNDVENGGNSCYISSVIWAMIHALSEIKGYITPENILEKIEKLKMTSQQHINISDVQKQFQELVDKISSEKTKTVDGMTINNFRLAVQKAFPEAFEQMMNNIVNEVPNPGKEQEDAYPFLTCLIDECLDIPAFKNKEKSFQIRRDLKEPEVFEDKENYLYEGAFNRYFDKSDCGSIINIQMGEPSKISMPLNELVTGEHLEIRQRNIYEKTRSEKGDKKYRIIDVESREQMIVSSKETAPPYFIGHLARFGYDLQATKRKDPVSLSEELLFSIFPDEKAEEETGKVAYQTRSVVVHRGNSIAFGHYVTYCKEGDKWFLYDDMQGVSICDTETALKDIRDNGYLFFFEKK